MFCELAHFMRFSALVLVPPCTTSLCCAIAKEITIECCVDGNQITYIFRWLPCITSHFYFLVKKWSVCSSRTPPRMHLFSCFSTNYSFFETLYAQLFSRNAGEFFLLKSQSRYFLYPVSYFRDWPLFHLQIYFVLREKKGWSVTEHTWKSHAFQLTNRNIGQLTPHCCYGTRMDHTRTVQAVIKFQCTNSA